MKRFSKIFAVALAICLISSLFCFGFATEDSGAEGYLPPPTTVGDEPTEGIIPWLANDDDLDPSLGDDPAEAADDPLIIVDDAEDPADAPADAPADEPAEKADEPAEKVEEPAAEKTEETSGTTETQPSDKKAGDTKTITANITWTDGNPGGLEVTMNTVANKSYTDTGSDVIVRSSSNPRVANVTEFEITFEFPDGYSSQVSFVDSSDLMSRTYTIILTPAGEDVPEADDPVIGPEEPGEDDPIVGPEEPGEDDPKTDDPVIVDPPFVGEPMTTTFVPVLKEYNLKVTANDDEAFVKATCVDGVWSFEPAEVLGMTFTDGEDNGISFNVTASGGTGYLYAVYANQYGFVITDKGLVTDNGVNGEITDEPTEPVDPKDDPSDEPTEPVDPKDDPSEEPVDPKDDPSDEPVNPKDDPVDPKGDPSDEPTQKTDDPAENAGKKSDAGTTNSGASSEMKASAGGGMSAGGASGEMGGSPKTGDTTSTSMWIAIIVTCAVLAISVFIILYKRPEDK